MSNPCVLKEIGKIFKFVEIPDVILGNPGMNHWNPCTMPGYQDIVHAFSLYGNTIPWIPMSIASNPNKEPLLVMTGLLFRHTLSGYLTCIPWK